MVKFVKYLPQFKIEPIVLTVNPKDASFAVIDTSLSDEIPDNLIVFKTKSREPFSFYKKLTLKKEIPFGGFANEEDPGVLQKLSRFIRGNFFIPDARIGWNSFAYQQAKKIINEFNIKTVITSSPPHSTQLIGLKLKNNFGLQWIADLRDPWTDIYYYNRMYHSPIAKLQDRKKELKVLQNADKIIVVSESIKELFASKIKINEREKISVISNGFDEIDFKKNVVNENPKFVITYTGTLADNYHIDGFIEALIRFVKEHGDSKIQLQFVGTVSGKYIDIIENSVLKAVCTFNGHVDHNTSITYLMNSNALFLAIPDVVQNEGILTGKLFEYLAARKPIIGIGPVEGDAAHIIDECSAGQMFSYSDVDSIKEYINDLYLKWIGSEDIGNKSEVYNNYSREKLTKKLANLIP